MLIDENQCPLCGGNNACGVHDDTPGWCCSVGIPQGLLDLVPAEKQMKACICQACITRFAHAQKQAQQQQQ